MYHWLRNKKAVIYAPLIFIMLFAVACGSSTEPVIVEKEVVREVVKEVPVIKEVIKEVPKEVIVEKIVVREVVKEVVVVARPTAAPAPTGTEGKMGGTLNIGSTYTVDNLDPHKGGGWNYCEICYGSVTESLVRLFEEEGAEYGSLIPHPYLLESWTLVDPSTYDLKLHEGVKFHNVPPVNGRELVADDVVWSFEHMRQPDPLYVYRTLHGPLESLEATDKYTVRMNLNAPAFAIMRFMGLSDGSQIIPREVEEDPNFDADSTVIGTGPFIMKEWIPGTSIHTERNPDYRREGRPYLDEVNNLIIPDAAARMAAFRSDRIQLLDMEWGQAQTIYDDSRWITNRYPGSRQRGIGFQHRRPPFNDIRMRQAVQAALKLQDFVDILDDGEGKINTGYWWSMENIALDQSYVPKQDLEKARRLIKEAGYDPEVGIDVVTVCRSGDPYQCRIQEIVQDQLAEVGIKTSIVAMESGSWRTRTFTQYDFDIYSYSAPAHEIPERFHNLYVYGPSSSNSIGSANAELDAAMELAGASANQEEYEERWKAYQKIFMEQVPYVFLDTPFQYTAQQPYLRGYRNSVAGYNRFQWIADFWFDK